MSEIRVNVTKITTDEFSEITLLIADRATLFRHGILGLLKEHRPRWCCAEFEHTGRGLGASARRGSRRPAL